MTAHCSDSSIARHTRELVTKLALGRFAASEGAREAAWCDLLDALAYAFEALRDPACARRLGPVVPGATMARGARVPGTSYELDPVQAAFNLGTLFAWRDDRHAIAEHQRVLAVALGALLPVADYQSRLALTEATAPPTMLDVLDRQLRFNAVCGALQNAGASTGNGATPDESSERAALQRACIATTAVVTAMLGGESEQVRAAIAHPSCDVEPGVLASRAVWRALVALRLGLDGLGEASTTQGEDAGADVAPAVKHCRPDAAALDAALQRFEAGVVAFFPVARAEKIKAALADLARIEAMPVNDFVALLVRHS